MPYKDPHEHIRNLLPPRTRLGFVFDNVFSDAAEHLYDPNRKSGAVVFYCDGYKVKQADYDGRGLKINDHALSLDADERNSRVFSRADLFTNQFRPVNGADVLTLESLLGEKIRQSKLAVGVDVIFLKDNNVTRMIDRTEWELGDSTIRLLIDYPVILPNEQIDVDNSNHVLNEMLDLLKTCPRTNNTKRFVLQFWNSFNESLVPLTYHPEVGPLYDKVRSEARHFCTELTNE